MNSDSTLNGIAEMFLPTCCFQKTPSSNDLIDDLPFGLRHLSNLEMVSENYPSNIVDLSVFWLITAVTCVDIESHFYLLEVLNA